MPKRIDDMMIDQRQPYRHGRGRFRPVGLDGGNTVSVVRSELVGLESVELTFGKGGAADH
jgi:hypothetical protein